ncbi:MULTISPECIES: homoserine dehydrogenase [Brevibacillus]|jgi:homoserine dehydrogenase|uniref:Homoserine dehydrogenase n=1 Tax=Brevibacillus borstelensis AK1 TaxID=1300222 RepID=M8DH53_9BACL|nr:homoserine dehydrogenase [Brevibacillus borstelensis]EMT52782.1 homoserine dehydrogenase [Brevibacillus borstelensis AK1]KKX55793.1 homoserine dehydrogenase [Brevibacillus borstelensis cifa_chp40]MBE5394571.1 homoserine dehydrogenase [Brevibacillus borstelensis]MCC0565027.1 homoserine dehydrogenase [Brevibacillus borstelensis]MCM3470576.1 homoserine dehydrogenase [Brevibacillus borstelensis]
MEKQTVRVGLMGFGTVGTGVVRIIQAHQEDLQKQTGLGIEISKILVQNAEKSRSIPSMEKIVTTDVHDILDDEGIDVVVEVIGGISQAKDYILAALDRGKHVVTANKDLMALHGGEILQKAEEKGCDVFYEASVAGGIPILRALVEGFSSDRITKMMGIVNGTTNYILSKMSQEGADYAEVLKEAQALGYAEADPTSDVEGFDAARKMAILATLGFRVPMKLEDVDVKGISRVSKEDIAYGKKLGYEVKLLGLARRDGEAIEVSVQPTMVAKSHPLASVNGVFNAVYVHGEAVGETMFYGPGAGELPTATAVVSDLVTVVKNMKLGVNGRGMVAPYKEKILKEDSQKLSKYFLRMVVADKRGVLAQITQLLAEKNISLEQVVQQPYNNGQQAEIILVTHSAAKGDMDAVLTYMEEMDIVHEIKSCYRVEGGE